MPTHKNLLKPEMGERVRALLGYARVFGFEIPTLPPTIPVTQTLCIDVKDWATRFPFILLLSYIDIGALNSNKCAQTSIIYVVMIFRLVFSQNKLGETSSPQTGHLMCMKTYWLPCLTVSN